MIPSVGILGPAMLQRMGLLFHCQLTLNASTMGTWGDCTSPTSQRFSCAVERVSHIGNSQRSRIKERGT